MNNLAKQHLFSIILFVALSACKKSERHFRFSEAEESFINYSKGQSLKFIDSLGEIIPLKQLEFDRSFFERFGVTGRSGNYFETCKISYGSFSGTSIFFSVEVSVLTVPPLTLTFNEYANFLFPDSLTNIPDTLINGVHYKKVYKATLYKNFISGPRSDSATIFSNKDFGFIQFIYPDGKSVTRSE